MNTNDPFNEKKSPSDFPNYSSGSPESSKNPYEDLPQEEPGESIHSSSHVHSDFEEKVRDNLRDARGYTSKHSFSQTSYTREQIITYLILIIGVLSLFLNTFIGGLIIGVVAGYYFATDIIYYLRNIKQILNGHDHLRYITLTVLLLGFFITAPGIFIGAAIVAAFKQVMETKPTDSL